MAKIVVEIGERPREELCWHCPKIARVRFGSIHYCPLFHRSEDLRSDAEGYLLRWPECIEAERQAREK